MCGDEDTTRTTGAWYHPIRSRFVVGVVRSTDSKAADKSNITSIARSPLSTAVRISDTASPSRWIGEPEMQLVDLEAVCACRGAIATVWQLNAPAALIARSIASYITFLLCCHMLISCVPD